MGKYKITNIGKRGVSIEGKGLSNGESIITDKPYNGFKIVCEKIVEEIKVIKPKKEFKINEESE